MLQQCKVMVVELSVQVTIVASPGCANNDTLFHHETLFGRNRSPLFTIHARFVVIHDLCFQKGPWISIDPKVAQHALTYAVTSRELAPWLMLSPPRSSLAPVTQRDNEIPPHSLGVSFH